MACGRTRCAATAERSSAMHPAPEPLLAERFAEFDAVSVRHGEVQVLDVPALMLPLSQRTVILGANGAGKTTLLQLVQGLAQPTTGQVRRLTGAGLSGAGLSGAGRPGTGPTPAVRLAYVFQKPLMLRRSMYHKGASKVGPR